MKSLTDIEQQYNLLTDQRSIPDQTIHDDLIDNHFNTESLREFSKESYDKKFVEAKTILATVMRAHMWIHNFSLFVCQDCQ